MEIIRTHRIGKNGLLGFVDVQFYTELGNLVIHGIAVRVSKAGKPYLRFPARKADTGTWFDTVRPADGEAREYFTEQVINALRSRGRAARTTRAVA